MGKERGDREKEGGERFENEIDFGMNGIGVGSICNDDFKKYNHKKLIYHLIFEIKFNLLVFLKSSL